MNVVKFVQEIFITATREAEKNYNNQRSLRDSRWNE